MGRAQGVAEEGGAVGGEEVSEKRVRREGSSAEALELGEGGERAHLRDRLGDGLPAAMTPLEEKPRLRSTDPEEVATLVCSSGGSASVW